MTILISLVFKPDFIWITYVSRVSICLITFHALSLFRHDFFFLSLLSKFSPLYCSSFHITSHVLAWDDIKRKGSTYVSCGHCISNSNPRLHSHCSTLLINALVCCPCSLFPFIQMINLGPAFWWECVLFSIYFFLSLESFLNHGVLGFIFSPWIMNFSPSWIPWIIQILRLSRVWTCPHSCWASERICYIMSVSFHVNFTHTLFSRFLEHGIHSCQALFEWNKGEMCGESFWKTFLAVENCLMPGKATSKLAWACLLLKGFSSRWKIRFSRTENVEECSRPSSRLGQYVTGFHVCALLSLYALAIHALVMLVGFYYPSCWILAFFLQLIK